VTVRHMNARLAYANVIADDIVELSRFYGDLFGFDEIEDHRSPIYRCLDAGGFELGFNARKAYDLLGLAERKADGKTPVRTFLTFEVSSRSEVEAASERAVSIGGRLIKPPYETYYNAWQVVLEDIEGNVFRVNHRMGPRVYMGSPEIQAIDLGNGI
jgi:predicted enzyme related to lactoylglutathione lyase